ncbi:MAG: hypothetical protein GEU95_00800 [Rhizobiales bacterium]|nr:hypothetical protein [Hyphomicrobiales bacterium]
MTVDELLREYNINLPSDAPGRYYTVCPQCSHTRKPGNQKLKCLGVTIGNDRVGFGCNHCGWTGPSKGDGRASRPSYAAQEPQPHEPDPAALEIWRNAKPAAGTVVDSYLRNRRILLVPPSLRCGSTMHLGRYPMPTMVAAVQRPDGKVVAVQTTLLTHAGAKVPTGQPRRTVGALGDGAVRLAKATDVLGLAEGVEDALSAMQITGVPCWACLGAGRMHRVAIPDHVRELNLFGDDDEAGRAALERTDAQHRHRRRHLRYPPVGIKDWNDFLRSRPAAQRVALADFPAITDPMISWKDIAR